MWQKGTFCPCLLLMMSVTAVAADEIVEYSMYDELNQFAFDSEGNLAKINPLQQRFNRPSFSDHQFRNNGVEKQNESLRHNPKGIGRVSKWKFRPLEDKSKKIIKIEEPPVPQIQPMYRYPYYGGAGMGHPGFIYPMVP